MQIHPLFLRFNGNQENRFIEHYDKESIPFMRTGLVIGIALFASFGLLDKYLITNISPHYFLIRYGIVIPFGIITFFATFFKVMRPYLQIMVSYVLTLSGTGLVALILISQPPISYMYYAGLLLVVTANYTLFRVRFLYAILSGSSIVIIYFFAARYIAITPLDILISNVSFLLGANFIGIFSGYYFEFAIRRDFYLVEELQKERNNVDAANKSLEKKVQDRTNQLILSNQALKEEIEQRAREEKKRIETEEKLHQFQKMESIGTLSGGIAHDFNNILGTILGYTELIARNEEHMESHVKEYNQQISKASLRAKDLVQQLLTFSRQLKPTLVNCRLQPIVYEIVEHIEPLLPSNIKLEKSIDDKVGEVKADHNQIHQVVMNLCNNAQYAMKDEGGTLQVGLSSNGKNQLVIKIADTGNGMTGETLKRIFEPYYTTKPVHDGHGLGLAMVHGIVKNHKGEIKVNSEPGKGSVFEIFLPLAAKQ